MWLDTLIEDGLGRLTLLLKYAPNSEVLPMTTTLWIEAFTRSIGRIDEELDTSRIIKAFELAEERFEDWPSPAQVIKLMGPRAMQPLRLHHAPEPTPLGFRAFEICSQIANGEITKEEGNRLMEEERQ